MGEGLKEEKKGKRREGGKELTEGARTRAQMRVFIFFVGMAIVDYRRNFHQGCIK